MNQFEDKKKKENIFLKRTGVVFFCIGIVAWILIEIVPHIPMRQQRKAVEATYSKGQQIDVPLLEVGKWYVVADLAIPILNFGGRGNVPLSDVYQAYGGPIEDIVFEVSDKTYPFTVTAVRLNRGSRYARPEVDLAFDLERYIEQENLHPELLDTKSLPKILMIGRSPNQYKKTSLGGDDSEVILKLDREPGVVITAIAPNGKYYAYSTSYYGMLHVRNIDGSHDVTIDKIGNPKILWSPNSRYIAWQNLGRAPNALVHYVDVTKRNSEQKSLDCSSWGWSSDSKYLVCENTEQETDTSTTVSHISLVNVEDGALEKIDQLFEFEKRCRDVAFSPEVGRIFCVNPKELFLTTYIREENGFMKETVKDLAFLSELAGSWRSMNVFDNYYVFLSPIWERFLVFDLNSQKTYWYSLDSHNSANWYLPNDHVLEVENTYVVSEGS